MVLVWLGKEDPTSGAKRVLSDFIPRFLALERSEGLALFADKDPFCNDPDLAWQIGEETCSQWKEDWIHFFSCFSFDVDGFIAAGSFKRLS